MQNKSTTTLRRTLRHYRATSLVEVLVVLVILLIGVFAIIRVFPLGFTFLRNGEQRMRAGSLVHNGAEQTKSDAANLPDAVCYSYYRPDPVAGGRLGRFFIVDTDPDDMTEDPDPQALRNDVNKFRYIKGEPVKIGLPTPSTFITGGGFMYMVKYGPIGLDTYVGNPANAPANAAESAYFNLSLAVNSAPLSITDVNSGGGSNNPTFYRNYLRNSQEMVADLNEDGSGGAWVLFFPSTQNRVFTARYIKLDNDHDDNPFDGPGTLIEEKITVGANFFGWVQLKGTTAAPFGTDDAVQSGSLVVTREFTRLKDSDTWSSDDPYQYKLASSNFGTYGNLGILAFNPGGARVTTTGAGNQRPFTAYIDYAVLDWHIIHDDRDVPSVNTGSDGEVPLRTTLTRLKSLDYVNPDNTFFEGIFPPVITDANNNTDIMIIRLDTGAILNAGQKGRPGDYDLLKNGTSAQKAAQQGLDYWANPEPKKGSYATGVFFVNTNHVPLGTPLRILYKAEGEWAASLSKAMASYRVLDNGPTWTLDADTGSYYSTTIPDVAWRVTSGNNAFLYFPRTEINKGVTATLEVFENGNWHRTQPIQVAIDTPSDWIDAGGNTIRVAAVNITKYLRRIGWDGQAATWRVAGNVKGVSVKNRVIWKDGLDRNAPWRIQDLDTYLTQAILQ